MKIGWWKIKLGDVAEFRNGINYSKNNFGKGIKVINVRNFKDWSFTSYDDLDEINPSGIIRDDDLLKEGDIIFVRSNGNRELIGRSMFVKNIDEPITHSAFSIKTRFNSKDIEPRYFAYVFRTPIIRKTLSAHGGGTNINNLNQEILSRLEIDLPDLSNQRRILSILSAYDDLIENNTHRIKILEEMARLIYRDWFVELKAPGIKLRKATPEEKKVTGKDVFPEGWEVSQIKSFGVVATGKTPSKERKDFYGDFMQFIKTPDMHRNMFILNTSDKLSQLGAESQSGKILPPNSICVSCIGTVGVISITVEPAQTNQQINSIILKDEVVREYLFYALQDIVPKMKQYAGTGATMDNLSKGKFELLSIVSPPNRILEKYNSNTSSMFDEIKNLLEKNKNLCQTRDLLLPKLISGEVEV